MIVGYFMSDKNFKDFFNDYLDKNPIDPKEAEARDDYPAKKKSSSKTRRLKIDLHGQTVEQAKGSIDRLIRENAGFRLQLTVVTGRGKHSTEGGVLFRAIYDYINAQYQRSISKIDAPPAQTVIGGVSFRGSFQVELKA
jgi:DNA-nicking Smr family endonuclease